MMVLIPDFGSVLLEGLDLMATTGQLSILLKYETIYTV